MAKKVIIDNSMLKDNTDNLNIAIDNKVDKISGKGLSTNDYTTEEKEKLAGIAAGATANIGTITGIKMNGVNKGTSGVVDLGTIITKHQDISGKMNSSLKGTANGVAELDGNGKVPSNQLPSFVDDVIEGYLYNGKFYEDSAHTKTITGEGSKIYIDLSTDKTYRWTGSAYGVISETIALGETSSTAYRGDRGKTAYDHSQATHARTDATKVESSSTNGNIKINGTEATVYTHPGSGTNPHGTTKSDVGLGNVGNFKAVSTVANQGLTDAEKSNARANIGAGTSSFSGSYNDLSNKPTIPSVGNGTVTIKQAGTSKGTFTMNQSGNTTIELTDNNTTYGVATSSALGLVKSGTDITVDSSGNVSVNDDSHNHVISNVDGLQSALDGKAASSHSHTKSQITDFPTSLPASDVYPWAKASSKPSYSWSEIINRPGTFTPASHTHSYLPLTGGVLSGLLTANGALKVCGRANESNGDDEGIVISPCSNNFAALTLGDPKGKRSVFYFNENMYISHPFWRYNDGTSSYDLIHPSKNGTIATIADIPTIGTGANNVAAGNHTHNYAGSTSAGGAANSLSYFKCTSTINVDIDDTTANAIGYVNGATSVLGQSDGALYKQVYSTSWVHEIYGDYRTGQLAVRGKNNGTWQSWRTILDSTNYSDYALSRYGGSMRGNISYMGTKNTFPVIKFIDNTVTAYGNGVSIGGGGLTVIGGGVSSDAVSSQFTANDEKMIIANDYAIDFYTNCDSEFSSAKHITMNTDGTVTSSGYNIDNAVKLLYNSTTKSLNFVFS